MVHFKFKVVAEQFASEEENESTMKLWPRTLNAAAKGGEGELAKQEGLPRRRDATCSDMHRPQLVYCFLKISAKKLDKTSARNKLLRLGEESSFLRITEPAFYRQVLLFLGNLRQKNKMVMSTVIYCIMSRFLRNSWKDELSKTKE